MVSRYYRTPRHHPETTPGRRLTTAGGAGLRNKTETHTHTTQRDTETKQVSQPTELEAVKPDATRFLLGKLSCGDFFIQQLKMNVIGPVAQVLDKDATKKN